MGCKPKNLIPILADAEDCLLQRVKTKHGDHPASCSMDTEDYYPGIRGRGDTECRSLE
jgi:hypothetical protein